MYKINELRKSSVAMVFLFMAGQSVAFCLMPSLKISCGVYESFIKSSVSTKPSFTRAQSSLRQSSMILDQFDTYGRSELRGRTYSTDPSLFSRVDKLNNIAAWTDPLVFSDKSDGAIGKPHEIAIQVGFRIALLWGSYSIFPHICSILDPFVYGDGSSVVSDRARAGLTGSFLPGVSLLFGSLFSYTISLLVNRQQKIEELVNSELASLSSLLWHLVDLFDGNHLMREAALKAIWRHTDQLIILSRYQEILDLVQDDPIEEITRMIIKLNESDISYSSHPDKSNINRELLGYLRPLCADINRLRALRISAEGRTLPPVHFWILGYLAMLLLVGFTLTSMQAHPETDMNLLLIIPEESKFLFALLVNAFFSLLEFALDLTNPFSGRYKVRRTTATAYLIKIRNEIVQVLGTRVIQDFDAENRTATRRELNRFKEITGSALPSDSHL